MELVLVGLGVAAVGGAIAPRLRRPLPPPAGGPLIQPTIGARDPRRVERFLQP